MRLSELTTLRLGGHAHSVQAASTEAELIELVSAADSAEEPLLLIAGGSNLVISDDDFPGRVVLIRTKGIDVDQDACSGATVTVQAGENFDDLVQLAISREWIGIEALSGIPGSVGATPIQNVGAYGQEVADTIVRVRAWDRAEQKVRTLMHSDCDFAYRDSWFKREPNRFIVLSVTFQFELGNLGAPVKYRELATSLGAEPGERVLASEVRDKVLALRRSKGMVLDAADHDTWSAGSFFTNPILTAEAAEKLPSDAPRYPQADGTIKTSAAWLIDHAGFSKGYAGDGVSLSSKHVLALTNRGEATTEALIALAREVRTGVREKFGIDLVPEPVFIGIDW